MAERVRDIISLRELGDTVKADEITAKLKTLKRMLSDSSRIAELCVKGDNVIAR